MAQDQATEICPQGDSVAADFTGTGDSDSMWLGPGLCPRHPHSWSGNNDTLPSCRALVLLAHFSDEETEAQRGPGIFPVTQPGPESGRLHIPCGCGALYLLPS